MNEDNRKRVYDVLKEQTGYLDSYEDFNKAFDASEDNRRRVYDVLKNQTGYLDSYEDFTKGMSAPATSVAQQVIDEYDRSNRSLRTTPPVVLDNPAGNSQLSAQSPEETEKTLFANYVREQLGNIDNELNKPREALPMPAGSAFIPSTAVAAAQRYGNVQTREQQDRYTSLRAARNFLDDANKLVTEAGKKGKTNFVSGALRGLRDKGFDPDTWTMGITETAYYDLLRQAAEKEERGEQLSSEEQQLLDAAAVNMAANAYYAQDLGRGYKAGSVTAESIPFMLQFALNPVSGAGKGIAKTILEHGIKRFGLNTAKRTAVGRAVRGAARMAGDAVAAAGVTATTGAGNVAEDADRRMAGDVQFSQDGQGDVHYAGRVNNVEDTGEAIARAFTSTFFENQSEMVGNYFAPVMRGVSGLVKRLPGVKQLSASKAGELYRGIKNNPTYKEFTDRTQWHGAIGEYAEEVYNNLASVAMGDMTPEELVDLDNNIDTFLGVGLMSAVFGGIGAAGFARDRYTLNRDVKRFESTLSPDEMEHWQEVKRVAQNGDVEGVREFVKYTMRDSSLTPQEKKDEIKYIYDVMQQSAVENVAAEQTEEAVQAEADDIVANSDPQTNTYTECSRLVMNEVGEMVEVPGHIVGYMGGQPLWKPDGAGPEVEAVALKEGEYNPESIKSMPTQEIIDETAQAIREDAAEQAQRESTYSPDIVPVQVGATFTDGEAQYKIAQQNPDNPHGGWLATRTTVDEKGKPKEEVVEITDEQYYNAMQAQIDAEESAARQGQQSTAPATYSINQEKINSATVSDYKKVNPNINESYYEENPESIKRDLSEGARYAADYLSGRISDRDYLLSLNYVDSYLDGIGTDRIRVIADEKSRSYMPYLNREEDAQQPAPANPAQSQAQSGSEVVPSSLQVESNAVQFTEPATEELSDIPTDEKGNFLYHLAPVDRTVSSINSEGLEPDEVDAFVQANKAASAKLLRNIEGKAPKMGTNIAQYKKAKQEWQARVDDAQAQVDYWNQVADAIAAQRTQVGDTTAEDILAMGEPMNGYELAAQMLATGKLPLLQSDFKRETGYKGDEARALFGLFASEANGGMTIERAGEQLMLADQEAGTNFFDQSDPNAGRNAILDVLSEVRTRGDLTNYIRRNREAMAERERQAEYDAYADWCDREMHMTPEEYEAYQEYVAANNPYEGVPVAELDRIFAEAEEEIQTYLNQQDNGQQGTSENGSSPDSGPSERDEPAGAAEGREAGVSVLPEAQPVLPGQVQGRAEGTASQPGTADDGVRAEEGAVSEGTSGGEGIENQINDENNEINVVSSQSNQNDTENEQGEVAGISGESSSIDGENEAAAILRTTGHSSTTQDGQGSQSKESLLGELAERASGSNQWIDDITSITSSPIGKGGENETYLSRDGRFAIKVNDFSYLPDNSTNFDSFMNRVDAHNELFPNDSITVLGFTRNSEGKIAVVLSQPYIGNAREATQEEIDNFLEGMDFYTDMSGNWTDGTFDIADTKPNNVLVDADGNLHFIDVLPYDSRKPGKMLVIPPTRNAFVAPEREEGENLLDYAERVVKTKEIDDARKEVEANPTDAQKEAGNYRKGHITLEGYDITIENPKGSTRSGVDANGQPWSVTMNNDYGYIRGTEGVDGDHIDVFLSDDPTTGKVYVIDQVNADGSFDEHKVMYGFKSALAAKRAYLANYSPGWKGLGTISEISKEEFKKWVNSSHRKTKPFAEYKSVKAEGAQNEGKPDNDHLPDAGKMNREQEETEKVKRQSGPVEKIEDVGEKIGGAKKDRFKEFAEKEKQLQEKPDSFMEELRKLPVCKIFNFNLEALRKDGLSNEAATLIDVIRRVIPSKPRTDWKLKRWMSDVFGLYRFCLTLATAEQGTFDQILRKATFIRNIGGMYRAQMALGGFDSGLDTGQATLEELGEGAGHYDKDDNWVSIKGQWYVNHAGRYGGIYPDYEKAKEALAKFAGENTQPKEKGAEVKFSVYSYKHSGEAFITPKGKPGIVVESGFKSSQEALDYLNEHMDELQAKYRNMKDATSIGFAPNGERRGKDWRGGKDVTAEDFRNTFGFRGVEFGNWANQQERQRALNQAYDAFMDLSEATGISPRGLSLGGELGMAFGARGGGGAAAHYEPGKVVINLTKTQGAGTLAHEWWHAIDNYFSRRRGQALGYNTERKGYNLPVRGGKVEREHEAERKEITHAFSALMKAISGSSYGERSNAYAGLKSSYWKEPTELGARAFAVWVERKLSEKGIVNNFLANNNVIGWESPELTQKYYPYPLESDFESLDVAFDNLFGTIEEKVDEETGNTVLYRFIGEQGASRLDASEEATTRMDNLAIARKMEEEGKNAWAIKWATGWERGADRKWRYETPDFEYTPPENFEEGKNYNLSDIIKDNELFTAYPKLRGLKFRLENLPDEYGGGWFGGNEIVINTAYNNPSRYESTIAHEIQHAIQAYEGFETGDNPDDVIDRYLNAQYEIDTADIYTLDVAAFIRKRAERLIKKGKYKYMRWAIRAAMGPLRGRNDMYSEYGPIETLTVYHTAKELKDAYEKAYKNGKSVFAGMPTQNDAKAAYMRNAGETEARNVERRLQMKPEQRRNMLASETEDVARRDQLFINSALSEQASYAPAAEDMNMVNGRFNKELQRYQDGQMSKNDMFHLGNPYGTMRMFLPDLPIVMRQRIVNKGSNRKHDVDVTVLQDMPARISEPIFVFKKNDGSVGILTEMKDRNGRNAFVAFDIATTIQNGGEYLEVNNVTTVHGRRVANIVRPILENDSLQWVDKEKALNWFSSASPDVQQEITNQELSDATKIVENFENPIIEDEKLREGVGNLSDAGLSTANDPVSKFLGKSTRTANQRRAFAERERRNMTARVQELAGKLHLDNVEIVNEPMAITDRKGKTHYPKGFYNRATDKIVIVIPNNSSTFDAEQTLLHEAVAHYGLRRLFGEHFDTFLDNVFNNADVDVRRKIVELAKKNGWDTRLATEEYLASLAENTNFENLNASWWRKIKELFLRMLHKIGFNDFNGVTLSDNELRYILWRSYENLAEPGRYRSILGEAADVVKQHELKVGNYAQVPAETDHAAEEANDLYRETPDGEASDDGSREAYNRAVAGNRFKAQEAYQDSMLALKRLQEVVEKFSGNKLKSYENAYMAENQMSSKSTREAEVYGQKFFKPMLQEVATLMKQGAGYPEIIDYMIAKHGLERNEVFAERDATQEAERRFEKSYKELEQLYKLGNITQDDYEKRKNKIDTEKEEYYQKRLAQHLEEDYSGLTALAEKYDEADKGFKANAKDMVNDFEGRFDTRALWERVNAATKETLRKSYESGMMSRDTYDKVSKMFNHYIPLRGWDVDTAEDVFEYLNSEISPVNSVLKSAKGRRSMSDDPLATIGNMAESAILQGNRNLMKQNFLNMAINHPTDVLTVREAWYVKDPNTGEWILSFPNIEENDDADAIARKVEEHEERMNMLKENGEATKVKEGLNIDYRISARQAKEHIVNVKRNGKDYLIFVNGNPRAAQAVNGMTNPSVETNKLLEGISRFNRQLAANFTNRNPAFVLSNLSRDLIFAVSAVNIKEGGAYARRFATNIPRAMRVIARNLRGKGDANHADDALFEEFLNNGGETGYTSLHSVDEYKRMVSRELNKITGKRDYFRAVRASAQFFSMMNRWAEDVSRFTTYMTSREQGKTISESVNDAKEVTVNFNKKGAGAKTSGVFGWTSGLFRNLYLFFNAAVQSLANFSRLSKKNPRAFYTTLGGFTTAGFLVPVLNGIAISMLGGDDDDYYGNLPEWVRRNNLCLYAGNGKFITIPLPIELRAFYGLGEMAYQTTISEDTNGGDKIAYQAINQITELLPINPLGNNGDLVTTLMPDVISPFWQIYENKDFTGKPIYRQNAFNETMPEWTKAYNSTSDWLVKLSEWANELAGGDKYKQADVMEPIMNWNPAKVEHLFESYFGGMAKTFNQAAKTLAGGVESVLQGEKSDDLQWYNTPVLNRFINDASDDRSAFSNVNERYYRLYDLYEEVGKELRGYGREAARGDLDYLDKLNRLYQSDDYKKYLIFKGNKRIIDRIRDMEKRLPEESTKEKEDLQKRVAEMKRSLLEQIDGIK